MIEENIKNGIDKKGEIFDQVSASQVDLINFRMYIKQNNSASQDRKSGGGQRKRKKYEGPDYIISPLSFRMMNSEKVFYQETELKQRQSLARIDFFKPIEALAENKSSVNR